MADQRAKLRRAAAKAAVVYLSDYLKTFLGQAYVGLDSGRTSDEFVKALARKPALRKKIIGVSSSMATQRLAEQLGIELFVAQDVKLLGTRVDIYFAGADQVDKDWNAVKGGGGCHLREKSIAYAANHLVIMIDASKLAQRIGEGVRIPIEVKKGQDQEAADALGKLGAIDSVLRMTGKRAFVSDNGNHILDAQFTGMKDLRSLEAKINEADDAILGNGIFARRKPDTVIVASKAGVQVFGRKDKTKFVKSVGMPDA